MSHYQAPLNTDGLSSTSKRYLQALQSVKDPKVNQDIAQHLRFPFKCDVSKQTNIFDENSGSNTLDEEMKSPNLQKPISSQDQSLWCEENPNEMNQFTMCAPELPGEPMKGEPLESGSTLGFTQYEPSTSSCDFFKAPKRSKRRSEILFNNISETDSHKFNVGRKLNESAVTEVLFGDKTISESTFLGQQNLQLQEEENLSVPTKSAPTKSFTMLESNDDQLSNNIRFRENVNISEEIVIDESLLPKRCRDHLLEKTFMRHEKINISTSYSNRYMVQTSQNVIDSFYKVRKFQDWKAIAENMVAMMEPSLDYLQASVNGDKRISLGDHKFEVCDEDFNLDSNEIRESLEEIEQSFESPDYGFVASTPTKIQESKPCKSSNVSETASRYNHTQRDHSKNCRQFSTLSYFDLETNFVRSQMSKKSKKIPAPDSSNLCNFNFSTIDPNDFMFSRVVNAEAVNSDDEPDFHGFTPDEQQIELPSNFTIMDALQSQKELEVLSQQNPT